MKTVLKFDRLGRGPAPADVELEGKATMTQILDAIEKLCRKRLMSRGGCEISVYANDSDPETPTRFSVEYGRYGGGTIEYVSAEPL